MNRDLQEFPSFACSFRSAQLGTVHLCPTCRHGGPCRLNFTFLLDLAETRDMRLVRIIRNTFFWLTVRYELTPMGWRDFIHDRNRDLCTTVLDAQGQETFIDLDALEASNDNESSSAEAERECEREVTVFEDNLRSYLDDTCCKPVSLNTNPVIHEVNRDKFIAISSVIAAAFPHIAAHWPRHKRRLPIRALKPANDNFTD